MSRFSAPSLGTPAGRPTGRTFAVDANIGAVIEAIGNTNFTLAAAMHERMWDLVNHHRKTVVKTSKFPGGLRARRLLFAVLRRYGAKRPNPTSVSDVRGASLLVSPKDRGDRSIPREAFGLFDTGGVQVTSDAMAIPIGAGRIGGGIGDGIGSQRGDRGTSQFYALLRSRSLRIVPRPNGPALLVATFPGRGPKGERSAVLGILVKRRRQEKLMDFYGAFDQVWPRHQEKIARDLDKALTEAGRAALGERFEATRTRAAIQTAKFAAINDRRSIAANAKEIARYQRALKRLDSRTPDQQALVAMRATRRIASSNQLTPGGAGGAAGSGGRSQ